MGVNQSFPKGNPLAIQPSPLATNHRSLAEASSPREPMGSAGSVAGIAPTQGTFIQPCRAASG